MSDMEKLLPQLPPLKYFKIETNNQITMPHSMVKNIEKQRAKKIYKKEQAEDPPGVKIYLLKYSINLCDISRIELNQQ